MCQRAARGNAIAPMRIETPHMGKNLDRSEATPLTIPLAMRATQMPKKAPRMEKSKCQSRILGAECAMAFPVAQKARVTRQMSAMERISELQAFFERAIPAA